jgi:hypothetical protein
VAYVTVVESPISVRGNPMSAHASRTAVGTVDRTANAVGSAFESVKHGASEIQTRVVDALPATSHFLARVVYKSAYAVSFGVTFPVMMFVRILPKDNALVHGVVDGALAARDQVYEWSAEHEEDLHLDGNDTDRASENGSADSESSSNRATHRRARTKRAAARKTGRSASRKKS